MISKTYSIIVLTCVISVLICITVIFAGEKKSEKEMTWSNPVIIAEFKNPCLPVHLSSTPEGLFLVVSVDKDESINTHLYFSEDKGKSWTQIETVKIKGWARASCYKEGLLYILCHKDYDTAKLYKVNTKTKKEEVYSVFTTKDLEPEDQESRLEAARMIVSDNSVYIVDTTHGCNLLFTKSIDGGKTWEKVQYLGKNLWGNDAPPPAFYIFNKTLNVIYFNKDEKQDALRPVLIRSEDNGKTWKKEKIDIGKHWIIGFDTEVVEKVVYLTFVDVDMVSFYRGKSNPPSYFCTKSNDGGKTWSKAMRITNSVIPQHIGSKFDITAVGSELFFSCMDMQRRSIEPDEACLFISKDNNVTWKKLNISMDIKAKTMFPVLAIDEKTHTVFIAFLTKSLEKEQKTKGYSLIFRKYGLD